MQEALLGQTISFRARERAPASTSAHCRLGREFPRELGTLDAIAFLQGREVNFDNIANYRRLLLAITNDPLLNPKCGRIEDLRACCEIISPQLLGSAILAYQLCHLPQGRQFEPLWRSYVEEALVMGRLGCLVAQSTADLVPLSTALMSAIVPSVGVALQISIGSEDQRDRLLRKLSQGAKVYSAIRSVYGNEPTAEVHELLKEWGVPDAAYTANPTFLELLNLLRADSPQDSYSKLLSEFPGVCVTLELSGAARQAVRESYVWSWFSE